MQLEKAKEQIAKSQLDNAIQTLLEFDNQGLSTAESQYLLGTLYHRKNQFVEAEQAFKRSLLLDANFIDSAISLSIIYNDTGHYDKGLEVFEQAMQARQKKAVAATSSLLLDKEISHKHLDLGNLYLKLQRPTDACQEFLKAIRINPQNIDARICLAKSYAQQGQSKTAQEMLQKLINENPQKIRPRIQLALLYYSLGDAVEAQIELNQALAIEPNNAEVQMYLSLAKEANQTVN